MARENIRQLRKLRKMSQGALAKAAGLTASEYSRIECGYRDLSPKEASAIAKALKVEVHELGDGPRQEPAPVAGVATDKPTPAAVVVLNRSLQHAGDDLNDPANFRELPDFGILERGPLETESFRTRLCDAVDRATKILHTSRVPAAVWRAWRDFERRGQEVLRATAGDDSMPSRFSPDDGDRLGAVRPTAEDALAAGEQMLRASRSSKARHREKSFNALFFDAARNVLPPDSAAKLTDAAERRFRTNASIGFMRHFRNLARDLLPVSDVERIAAAITASEQGRGRGRYAGSPAVSSFNLLSGSRTSGQL